MALARSLEVAWEKAWTRTGVREYFSFLPLEVGRGRLGKSQK
jgi:hypothetical protein